MIPRVAAKLPCRCMRAKAAIRAVLNTTRGPTPVHVGIQRSADITTEEYKRRGNMELTTPPLMSRIRTRMWMHNVAKGGIVQKAWNFCFSQAAMIHRGRVLPSNADITK